MHETLKVHGAREHNLKAVNVEIPRHALVVFTGLSGSGKSSLAFDTIFAEGQRRYVESLSSYARQFLGRMDKPLVDFIEGLSPAVSIDQKSTSRNPRSTVGTITEIYDYLRLLYARVGVQYCPECGAEITAQSAAQIVNYLFEQPEGTRLEILAPVVRGRKGEYSELFADLQSQGFNRVRVDGESHRLEKAPTLEKQLKHNISVSVDRVVIREGSRSRVADSIETALSLTDGLVAVDFVDTDPEDGAKIRRFSEKRACPNNHPLALEEVEPRTFSFNAPYGACPACTGLGSRLEIDPELVVPDPDLTLREGAVAPWAKSKDTMTRILKSLGDEIGFSLDIPWRDLSKKTQEYLMWGKNYKVKVRYRNRWGRERIYATGFEGAAQYIQRKHDQTDSELMKAKYEGYMREVPCPTCQGQRLKPEVLAVRVGDLNISQFTELCIEDAQDYLKNVKLTGMKATIAAPIFQEVDARLQFLLDVGLGYLTLSRPAGTLSGGEAQRIRLATQIGSGLVGVLYVLDEPSIGLHQRDNQRLIETLKGLRNLGNTLIVVEHDEETIRSADWVVDIGPGAGEHGGEIVHSGTVAKLLENRKSITADYLAGRRSIAVPSRRRPVDSKRLLTVIGARENNLCNIDVSFPLGCLVAVTGVSGSGKSTLVNSILYQALARDLNHSRNVPGRHKRITGLEHLDKIIHVDQSPIGRTPRSNPATYTGVWDHIRKLFASTEEARVRGYGPGRFSFNVKGGRCEACHGDGTLKIEMNFLPDVYVPCEVCGGARYNRETLEVKYHGKNVREVLDMTISEATDFFSALPAVSRYLHTLTSVGLGYVKLGQSATTLSGGEAQRVKLASELHKRSNGRSVYVLDEPTTGLHIDDIAKLMAVLQGLVEKGNTVIVIEHNLDVIKCADWVIDMGPEGGKHGGRVIATGTPEQVAKTKGSFTGQYLKQILKPPVKKG